VHFLRAAALFAVALPLAAQEPVFRTETTLATVPFHVVQRHNYVVDLRADDIVLLEDGAPQQITFFEGGLRARRTLPVEMILLFDTSGSVVDEGLLDPLVFKSTLLDNLDNVRIAIYGFGAGLQRYCRPTRDTAEMAAACERVRNPKAQPRPETIRLELPPKRKADPRGGTWLYEAVRGCARDVARGDNATRMMLVFSDGFPTTDTRPEEGAAIPRELGIAVYPVVLGHGRLTEQFRHVQETGYNKQGVLSDGARDRLARLEDQQRQIEAFASLGELTGGRSFDPPLITLDMVRRMLGFMVGQVRCEYIAGFTPQASGESRKHKLEVRLRNKEMGKVLGGSRVVVH